MNLLRKVEHAILGALPSSSKAAEAAVAIVVEKAAKVADGCGDMADDMQTTTSPSAGPHWTSKMHQAREIAAAIRKLASD